MGSFCDRYKYQLTLKELFISFADTSFSGWADIYNLCIISMCIKMYWVLLFELRSRVQTQHILMHMLIMPCKSLKPFKRWTSLSAGPSFGVWALCMHDLQTLAPSSWQEGRSYAPPSCQLSWSWVWRSLRLDINVTAHMLRVHVSKLTSPLASACAPTHQHAHADPCMHVHALACQ